jgi:hypothetical protein
MASNSPPAASRRLDFRHRRSHGIIGQHLTESLSLSLQTAPVLDFVRFSIALAVLQKSNHDESGDFFHAKVDLHWIPILDFV